MLAVVAAEHYRGAVHYPEAGGDGLVAGHTLGVCAFHQAHNLVGQLHRFFSTTA